MEEEHSEQLRKTEKEHIEKLCHSDELLRSSEAARIATVEELGKRKADGRSSKAERKADLEEFRTANFVC